MKRATLTLRITKNHEQIDSQKAVWFVGFNDQTINLAKLL